MPRLTIVIFIVLSVASLSWCIYRDIQIEKHYPGDLRNRVLGARLQMDGISPYYYRWGPGSGIRYYDPESAHTRKLSNVTATPFFHQLLYPIANLPHRTISRLWLLFQYLALIIMTALAFVMTNNLRRKRVVLITGLLFLYTYAWTTHINVGQMYIFISLIAFLFFFFISRKPSLFNAAAVGMLAAVLILVKPTTLIFFSPFLLLANKFSLKYILTTAVSFSAIFLLTFGSSQSRMYWSDYRHAMQEHIRMHQGTPVTRIATPPLPRIKEWEGWDMDQVEKDASRFHYKYNGEHGNVFVILNSKLNTRLSVTGLALLYAVLIAVLSISYYKKFRKTSLLNFYTAALLGFCFYMAADMFSPVHRFLYNTIQLIFPLLLIAGLHPVRIPRMYIIILFLCFLLNTITIQLFPMQATVGEYIAFATILAILLTTKTRPAR
jgi:hypothetical protein